MNHHKTSTEGRCVRHKGFLGKRKSREDFNMKAIGFIVGGRSEQAPGGVPTMAANDNDGCLTTRVALRFFASMLAPTGEKRGTKTKPLPACADRGFGI
jgi:hypothetical protein